MPRSSSKMGYVGARPCTGSRNISEGGSDINGRDVRRLGPMLSFAAGALALAIAIPLAAQQPPGDTGNYVGPGSCSAVACHGAVRPVAGARILQTEYTTWIARDRHARATEVLSGDVSQRMARILGVG